MADRSSPHFYVRLRPPGSQQPVSLPEGTKITAFKFEDDEQKTDKLSITVDNYDLRALDGDTWMPGATVMFQFGYPGRMSPEREAVVVKLGGFASLNVEADSKDVFMNRVQRVDRSWQRVKRSDVVREVVQGYGYRDEQLHIEDTKVLVESVTQARMTDLQLIKSLASREGFEFFLDFDGVHFHRRDTKQTPIRELVYFADPGLGDILSINMDLDARVAKPGAINMGGQREDTGERFTVRASTDTLSNILDNAATALANTTAVYGPNVIDIPDEVGQFTTEDNRAAAFQSELVGAAAGGLTRLGQEWWGTTTEKDPASAQRAVDGVFAKQQLRGVTLTVTTILDPMMFAKSVVRLSGVGNRLGGNWYVKNAVHDVYAMTTTLKLARAGLNGQGAAVNTQVNNKAAPGGSSTVGDVFAAPGAAFNAIADNLGTIDILDKQTGETTSQFTFRGGRGQ